MEPTYVVALEIGSSKIKGIVAAADATRHVTVIAIEETDAADCVRRGRIQNPVEVSTRVSDIIRRFENNTRLSGARISQIFVARGGRSTFSQQTSADVRLGSDMEITQSTLDKLHNEARYSLATDRDILAISDRRFVVDGAEVKKLIGSFGNAIHGEFTIVTQAPDNLRNLDRVKIESRGSDVPRHYIPRTIAQADMMLSDSERQLGCLLIDFGAETTSIAVYREDSLQVLAVLPFGSSVITRDLSNGMGITIEEAEKLKITRGVCVDRSKTTPGEGENAEIANYISSRVGEIIANIINYVEQAGFKLSDLGGGIIVTGGGTRLKGFTDMLEAQAKAKVRVAVVDSTVTSPAGNSNEHLDVIALVKYALANYANASCIELPKDAAPAIPETPAFTGTRVISEDDPKLLIDDEEDDDKLDEELPPQAETPEKTRSKILKRLKDWFVINEEEESELDENQDDDLK